MFDIFDYKNLSSEHIAMSRLERKRYSVRREYRERAVNSSDAAKRIFAQSERRVSRIGRSVGRSGSLTRTVADPSVDYSGDLTWTWKQVLGIRFSILHTTLINAARLLHRIGTYAAYGELAHWTLARGRMRYLVIPSGIMLFVRLATIIFRSLGLLKYV